MTRGVVARMCSSGSGSNNKDMMSVSQETQQFNTFMRFSRLHKNSFFFLLPILHIPYSSRNYRPPCWCLGSLEVDFQFVISSGQPDASKVHHIPGVRPGLRGL